MSKIKIKNFGPIKEGYQENDGWMDVKKVTVFIGNQGSGKSTVAKVISTMLWIEKANNRRDKIDIWSFYAFKKQFEYQSLDGYFQADTVIEFIGERYTIKYNVFENEYPIIGTTPNGNYSVPKIMYVPSERNFLSVIKGANGVRGLPEPLFEFASELKRGQLETNGNEVNLPINDVKFKYEEGSDTSYIIGPGFKQNLLIASSGFQSLVPLFLVTRSLAQIIHDGSKLNASNMSVDQSVRMRNEIATIMTSNQLTNDEKLQKVEEIQSRFQNKAFINIVEEPEQNLFPSSQQLILNSLLEFNNMNEGNKLIMTTHSPYLINFISLAVKANDLKDRIKTREQENKLLEIVPISATINPNELVIYQFDEMDGSIKKLGDFEGIPSDKNFLNQSIRSGNLEFDTLLEIEQELEL